MTWGCQEPGHHQTQFTAAHKRSSMPVKTGCLREERSALIIHKEECRETIKTRQDKVTFFPLCMLGVRLYNVGNAFVVAFHHRNSNILKLWEWLNDEKQFFMFKFNHINKHLYFENNCNHLKLRYPDLCNFLTKRVLGEPTKHACGC